MINFFTFKLSFVFFSLSEKATWALPWTLCSNFLHTTVSFANYQIKNILNYEGWTKVGI